MMIPINDKSSYPGPRDDGGFTLIEVLIVLLIIGLVSLMVIPSVNRLKGRRDLDRAARLLVADMTMVQQTAIAYGKTCRMEFYTGKHDKYIIYIPGENSTGKLPAGITTCANNFPTSNPGGFRLLSFNRRGAPNRGGTIGLANEHGECLYIIVFPATGRIRISENPPENW